MPKNFIDPFYDLIQAYAGPDPNIFSFFTPFYIPREAPPEDVLDMFNWFFPILPKMPNLMLIVYLPKIFSSIPGLFRLDPLHLLSAGTVLTLESSVRCVSGVLVCVPHYNESMQKYIDMECCVSSPSIQFQ